METTSKAPFLATHNSMTYLTPVKWWMKLLRPIYRCQSKTIGEQYEAGVRMFDFRIDFDSHIVPLFRHGIVAFKGNVFCILYDLSMVSSPNDPIYVRIILERAGNEDPFTNYCRFIERMYPSLHFFGGVCKEDWGKVLYPFKTEVPAIHEAYQSRWRPGVCPWLYAWWHNKRNKQKLAGNDIFLMLDFFQF